jgi:hypothetical protein
MGVQARTMTSEAGTQTDEQHESLVCNSEPQGTDLRNAARQKDTAALVCLLANLVNRTELEQQAILEGTDESNNTALHIACRAGCEECVDTLANKIYDNNKNLKRGSTQPTQPSDDSNAKHTRENSFRFRDKNADGHSAPELCAKHMGPAGETIFHEIVLAQCSGDPPFELTLVFVAATIMACAGAISYGR